MIVTLTLNPCIDKSSSVEKLKPESKLRCNDVTNEPGGGGINVSKALQELQVESVAMFPAGGHNGNMLKYLLKKEEIRFHEVDIENETRENWIILETESNSQFRFTFPGPHMDAKIITGFLKDIKSFSPSFVVASGSLPPGLPENFYLTIVNVATSAGAKCVIDTSGAPLKALKGARPYLIKPNIGELARLLGLEHIDPKDVVNAARRAICDGFADVMAVSMGSDGAWLISSGEEYFAEAPKVERKSTVGAGDSMVAGILYMLQNEKSLKDALAFGVACGTAATMNPGTSLFNKEDAFRLYEVILQKITGSGTKRR